MSRKQLFAFAATAMLCAAAWGANPQAPEMKFLAVPATDPGAGANLAAGQARTDDRMVVVLREPAACGARPSNPRFALEGSALRLGFDIERPADGAAGCVAKAIFTLTRLPAISLQVRADVHERKELPARVQASLPAIPATWNAPEGGARMQFLASPAVPVSGTMNRRDFVQFRDGEVLQVVLHEPAPCGERPASPSFQVAGDRLFVGYRVAQPAGSGGNCLATAMFTFHGLPEGDFRVVPLLESGAPVSIATRDASMR